MKEKQYSFLKRKRWLTLEENRFWWKNSWCVIWGMQ